MNVDRFGGYVWIWRMLTLLVPLPISAVADPAGKIPRAGLIVMAIGWLPQPALPTAVHP
jgi:hypothetical protein